MRNVYPTKEEVEEYYTHQLHTVLECAVHFNISKTKMYTCLRKYGIKRTKEDKSKVYSNTQNKPENKAKIRQTNIEKYGAANKQQALAIVKFGDEGFVLGDKKYSFEWFKEQYLTNNLSYRELSEELGVGEWIVRKICRYCGAKKTGFQRFENTSKTCQEKYGTTNPLLLPDIREKIKKTCMEKYGAENVGEVPEFKEKMKRTMVAKYGVENYTKTEEYKQKARQTNLDKYGAAHYMQKDIKHLDVWLDREKMTDFLKAFNEKPTAYYIKNYFNLKDRTVVYDKIHKWELDDLVKLEPLRSHYEDEIIDFLSSLNVGEICLNDREILDGKEIDIFAPKYKIGVEFNGDYWHSDIYCTDHKGRSTYHQEKSLLAEEKGIFLFQIFEHEWIDSLERENIKNRLRTLFSKNNIKIAARKTQLVELTKEQKKDFLDRNHIQGNDHSTKQYGLLYQDELVACMTFVRPKNSKYTWELSRFCNKHGCTVQGGASKLFKHFLETLEDGSTISSYNDITKTKGQLYEILGFECVSINRPNYVWINFQTRDIRTRYQEQAGGEVERMQKKGYHRVCDCGTKTWVYTKTSE